MVAIDQEVKTMIYFAYFQAHIPRVNTKRK